MHKQETQQATSILSEIDRIVKQNEECKDTLRKSMAFIGTKYLNDPDYLERIARYDRETNLKVMELALEYKRLTGEDPPNIMKI